MKGLSFVSERGPLPPLRRNAGVLLMVRHYSDRERASSSSVGWLLAQLHMGGCRRSAQEYGGLNFSFTTSSTFLAASFAESFVVSMTTSGWTGAS
jgi:hypothetical protein